MDRNLAVCHQWRFINVYLYYVCLLIYTLNYERTIHDSNKINHFYSLKELLTPYPKLFYCMAWLEKI